MVAAARLSSRYAGFSADEASRLQRLIERAGLPTAMPQGWDSDDFLRALGLPIQPWLLRPDYAMDWVIISNVWATVGFFALILLAGLQAIQPTLYEAAEVDGENPWRILVNVTLPLLMPSLLVVFILGTIRAFQAFEYIYVLTGGGPGFSTLMIVQYIYRAAFQQTEFGLAAAASLLLVVVLGILTGLQYVMGRLGEAI